VCALTFRLRVMTKARDISTAGAVCVFRLARACFKLITEMSVSVLLPTHICYEHWVFILNSEPDWMRNMP